MAGTNAGNARRLIRRVVEGRTLNKCLVDLLEPRRFFAADLVISEFLASNSTGLSDKFGDKSDWIEIHNRGNAAATLSDYYLTDDAANTNKWHFPAQNLSAGGYLIVFASNRNLAVAGQELHTNFKISAGSGYLGLMRADGTPQSDFGASYPAQTANISYGYTNENSAASATQYFSVPTPGAVNVPTAGEPIFSVTGKVFSSTFTVALTTPTTAPGTVIRYTLDRSEPSLTSSTSFTYSTPLSVGSTKMIRAKVFATNLSASPTVSQSYVKIDTADAPVDTNLGTVVIDTFGTGLNDTTMVLGSGTFVDNTIAGRSSATDASDYHGRVGVRTRGSTTQNLPKKSMAIELWDEANNDRKVSLLGMPADSDWVLYAAYQEKSLMQDPLTFNWGKELGLLAPRVRYVEVYLNTDGGASINYASDYAGVYILMEKIKVGSDRVDIAELAPGDNAAPNVTGGYLFKHDRIDPDELVITTASGQKFEMSDPETLTGAQNTYLTGYLNDFETALFGSNYKDPVNGYAKYVNVDSFVDFWILTEFTRQVDAYSLSTFYYKDRDGKLTMGPIWDWNISLGNSFYNEGSYAAGSVTDFINTDGAYIKQMLTDPAFKQRVVDRWAEIRRTSFSNTQLLADVDAQVAILSDGNGNYPTGTNPTQASNNAIVRNFKKWNTEGRFIWPNGFYDQDGRWIEDVKMMKNFIVGRANWMDTQYLPAPTPSVPSGFRTTPASVTLTPYRTSTVDATILGANSAVKAIIPTSDLTGWRTINYNTAGWMSGTGGVGYDTTTTPYDFNPIIGPNGINVGAMQGHATSVFIRYEFNVADPSAVQALILKMKYEDGFVAFINDHRIASYNDPGTGTPSESPFVTKYQAVAGGPRFEGAANSFQEFDVSALKGVLVAGTNVLAIQGLNADIDSNDLVILPELASRTRLTTGANANTDVWYTTNDTDPLLADGVTRNPAALLYTGAVAIATTTHLKFRSVRSGVWSGLDERYYDFETDALRVSEMMYHPANPPAGSPFGEEDFEFLEFRNASSQPIHLDDYAFTDGIEFTFPNVTLPANGIGVIVKNLAAFQSRYGTGITPIGVYTGNLNNAGETLTLTNPFAGITQTYAYNDTWYPSTDGDGPSLEVNGPATLDLNLSSSWRASTVTNGTPGTINVVVDTTPPTASNTQFLFETAPNKITLLFSEDVGASFGIGDVTVMNLTTGLALTPASVTFDAGTKIGTVAFAAGPLTDGDYRLTINSNGITDAAGNALDGDGNVSAGGDLVFDFFILAGDANRDRKVDFNDLVVLAQNYNQSGKTFSQGNFDYSADGKVDFNDLVILAQRYNGSLASVLAFVNGFAAAPLTGSTRASASIPIAPGKRTALAILA